MEKCTPFHICEVVRLFFTELTNIVMAMTPLLLPNVPTVPHQRKCYILQLKLKKYEY
jgi:hypothetical protein